MMVYYFFYIFCTYVNVHIYICMYVCMYIYMGFICICFVCGILIRVIVYIYG